MNSCDREDECEQCERAREMMTSGRHRRYIADVMMLREKNLKVWHLNIFMQFRAVWKEKVCLYHDRLSPFGSRVCFCLSVSVAGL